MRRPGIFVFLLVTAASSVAVAACSLVVDTNGLSGGAVAGNEGGGAAESGATEAGRTEAGGADAALPDSGFSCDGGTRITTFDDFMTTGTVTLQGSSLTASASTTAKNEQFSAVARRDFNSVPPRLLLTYDLVLTRSDLAYFEPGCGVYLESAQDTLLRQTFASNHERFSGYLNVSLSDGGTDSRLTDFTDSPATESSRHVELVLATSGTSVSVDVTVDGALQHDSLVLPVPPVAFFMRCGIAYGEQTSPAAATTTVMIRNLSVSLCP